MKPAKKMDAYVNENGSVRSESSDEEYMEVYNDVERFEELCGEYKHLRPFHNYHYYQCWGGGPEGGFITNGMKVYRVNRDWWKPFSVEKVVGILQVSTQYGVRMVRIVPPP